MFRFVQDRPFFTLALVIAAWLVLPGLAQRLARAGFYEFQAPIEVSASYARDLQDYWSLRSRSKNELLEAGAEIARLNASYELRLREVVELKAENRRLAALLNLPEFEGYRYEPARVVRRDFGNWWHRFIIRKGQNYQLEVGNPVIFVGGVVGRVSEVHAYTAVVDLISSPSVRLAASIEGDTRPISFQGAASLSFGSPRGYAEYVPLDMFATPSGPKRLITSGLGGNFPGGLPLGEITVLEPSSDGLFKSGSVRLDPRLAYLREVTVLVPIRPILGP